MKDFITPSLTFVPGTSGVGYVDLFGIPAFDVKRLVSLINQTTGTIIYSTADPSLRFTNVTGTQVYLLFDTSSMSGANLIQVVYDTPYPLPVSVSSLPLPAGAATAANQAAQTALLTNIDLNTPVLVSGRVPVDGSGVTQPISAAALPLPTGAATEARQADGNTSLTSIDGKTPVLVAGQVPVVISTSVPVTGPVTDTQLRATPVPVTVSGTATVTGPLTDAQLRATPVPISGTVAAITGLAQPLTDSQLRASAIDVNVTGTVLAVGAATSSNQGITNTLLTTINGKTPALGQAAMAASTPVVIASDQSSVPVTAAAPAPTLTSYTQAGVIAINTVLVSVDCTQARFLSIQCISMGTTGVVTPEWSNNNVNWVGAQLVTNATGATITTFNAAGFFSTGVYGRYFRLRLSTATTGGTTTLSVQAFDFFASPTTQATSLAALPALIAGSSLIGDVGIQYRGSATGAASSVSVLSPATPAAATIKGSAGRLLGCYLQNSGAALRSVKVFNATAPTLGSTSAAFEIDIGAGDNAQIEFPGGIAFTTAMTYSVTSAKGLTDNTSTGLTANDVSGFFAFA